MASVIRRVLSFFSRAKAIWRSEELEATYFII